MNFALLNRQVRRSASKYLSRFPRYALVNNYGRCISTINIENKKYDEPNYLDVNHASLTRCVSLWIAPSAHSASIEREIIEYITSGHNPAEDTASNVIRCLSLLVLATPEHISWLDPDCIERLLTGFKKLNTQLTSYEIDVVCACVDGLPFCIDHNLSKHESKSYLEGLSILYGSAIVHTRKLWAEPVPPSADSKQHSSLTFQHRNDQNLQPPFEITLPNANTLFSNGRYSTLIVSRYRITEKGLTTVKKPTYRTNVSIGLPFRRSCGINVPLSPLTIPRKIKTGLGNIVRSLQANDKCAIPASQELERAVTKAHKSQSLPPDDDVWALIIPPQADSGKNNQTSGTDHGSDTPAAIENLIQKGAKLCRVVSGGGGWGPKQGLLALDPETTFCKSATTPYAYLNEDSPCFLKRSDLDDLIEKGSFIRFFHPTRGQESDLTLKKDVPGNRFFLGTISESNNHQFIPSNSSSLFIPETFGSVSRRGIFYQSNQGGSTKIDVPYSFVQSIDSQN